VADALMCRNQLGEKNEVVGFLDDDQDLKDQEQLGARILGGINEIENFKHEGVVVGIGDNLTRQNIYMELKKRGENLITVIHPRTCIAANVVIGDGSVFFAGVIVNSGAHIGSNVIINTGATVDHDSVIGSHSHVCPGVHLGGGVKIGDGAFVGIGSSVIHNRTIGNWAILGAGAAVIRDVPAFKTVVGVPAMPLPEQPMKLSKPDDRDLKQPNVPISFDYTVQK
jgi:sugar O-acyltransferase (sialic acid O-acetyltransferase NeuD family)